MTGMTRFSHPTLTQVGSLPTQLVDNQVKTVENPFHILYYLWQEGGKQTRFAC